TTAALHRLPNCLPQPKEGDERPEPAHLPRRGSVPAAPASIAPAHAPATARRAQTTLFSNASSRLAALARPQRLSRNPGDSGEVAADHAADFKTPFATARLAAWPSTNGGFMRSKIGRWISIGVLVVILLIIVVTISLQSLRHRDGIIILATGNSQYHEL